LAAEARKVGRLIITNDSDTGCADPDLIISLKNPSLLCRGYILEITCCKSGDLYGDPLTDKAKEVANVRAGPWAEYVPLVVVFGPRPDTTTSGTYIHQVYPTPWGSDPFVLPWGGDRQELLNFVGFSNNDERLNNFFS
jgi:hypothetical protein